jgi:uncharacterized protein YdeI (YjbR/CyaY-like superfamily)
MAHGTRWMRLRLWRSHLIWQRHIPKNKTAKGYFDAFPRSVKRAILEWISLAKKPETRAKRIEETVTKAEKNIRANQWRQ